MNSDPRSVETAAPPKRPSNPSVDRTDTTVNRLMKQWPVKGFPVRFPARTMGTVVALLAILAVSLILSLVLLIGARDTYFDFPAKPAPHEDGGVASEKGDFPYADGADGDIMLPWAKKVDIIPADAINSAHAALADLSTGQIIASRKADEVIYPASMTKVMTLIVAVENLPDEDCLQDTITISEAVYEDMRRQGASGIGLEPGEQLTVESLLYALMLKSDGIAACELACYVAGSVEDFVELMNQKAEKMGLTSTHFENPTGLFHQNHTSTSREIASIMAYAMKMSLCRKVLLTQVYNAPCKGANGDTFTYRLFHNLIITHFEQISPNQPATVKIAAGKTGFTNESRYCLVTYAETSDGHGYVCVTAKGDSYASCIKDYITIYNTYAKP